MRISKLFIAGVILAMVVAGCSSSNESSGNGAPVADSNVHSPNNLNPVESAFHGLEATERGLDTCKICHGVDLHGSVNIPGCNRCHFSLTDFTSKTPEGSNWTHGTFPHGQLIADGETCNACHNALRQYPGQGPNACHDCHGEPNHPLGQAWLDKKISTFHGSAATADLGSCRACHGSDLLGGLVGVSCSECHFGPTGSKVPLGDSWVHGTVPHSTTALTDSSAVCNQCHTINRLYANGPDTCHDCHAVANHPLGQTWLDSASLTFHGTAALADVNSCKPCHGSDLLGGLSGVSCSQCHFGPTGNRVPSGVTWVHGTSHGPLLSYEATCNQCHTLTRQYRSQPTLCHDCHLHPTDGTYLSPSLHGPDAKGSVTNPDGLVGCQLCHGTPGGIGSNPLFIRGIASQGGLGCEGCHNFGTAHPSIGSISPIEAIRWYDAVPGDPAVDLTANWGATHNDYGGSVTATNACFLCHTVENLFLGTGTPCKTCHISDPTGATKGGCITCHGNPPDGVTVPNRVGNHNRFGHSVACNVCHTNNGPDSQDGAVDDPLAYRHFTIPRVQPPVGFSRADLESQPNTTPQSMTITVDPSNVTCTGSCHGMSHSESWY